MTNMPDSATFKAPASLSSETVGRLLRALRVTLTVTIAVSAGAMVLVGWSAWAEATAREEASRPFTSREVSLAQLLDTCGNCTLHLFEHGAGHPATFQAQADVGGGLLTAPVGGIEALQKLIAEPGRNTDTAPLGNSPAETAVGAHTQTILAVLILVVTATMASVAQNRWKEPYMCERALIGPLSASVRAAMPPRRAPDLPAPDVYHRGRQPVSWAWQGWAAGSRLTGAAALTATLAAAAVLSVTAVTHGAAAGAAVCLDVVALVIPGRSQLRGRTVVMPHSRGGGVRRTRQILAPGAGGYGAGQASWTPGAAVTVAAALLTTPGVTVGDIREAWTEPGAVGALAKTAGTDAATATTAQRMTAHADDDALIVDQLMMAALIS